MAACLLAVAAAFAAGALPFRDIILDAGNEAVVGHVEESTPADHAFAGPLWRIDYRFTHAGIAYRGRSFAQREPDGARLRRDDACPIQFQGQRPEVSRIEGTRVAIYPGWVTLTTSGLTLLGILGIYRFGRAALRLRIGIREGRATTAQVIEVQGPHPILRALHVRYRFVDHLGQEHISGHWTRSPSALGTLLRRERPRMVEVVHDRRDPTANRLLGDQA